MGAAHPQPANHKPHRPRARRSGSPEGPELPGTPKKSDLSNSYVYQHMYTVIGIDISH